MLRTRDEKEGLALRLRLKYELGVITGAQLREEADKWSPDLREEMRELFKEAVSSVTTNRSPAEQ